MSTTRIGRTLVGRWRARGTNNRSLRVRCSIVRALVWHGKRDVRCNSVPDPAIEDARDVIGRSSVLVEV
jgi:hypothetical protein